MSNLTARIAFSGVRAVEKVEDCTQTDRLYFVRGDFYRVIPTSNGRVERKKIQFNQITMVEWIQFFFLTNGRVLEPANENPSPSCHMDVYFNEAQQKWWKNLNGVWVPIDTKFVEDYILPRATENSKRDLEAVALTDKVNRDDNVDYIIRKGPWDVSKNSPFLSDDDNYPIGSTYTVVGALPAPKVTTTISMTVTRDVVKLPKDVVDKGVFDGDKIEKGPDGWKVIRVSKAQDADEIRFDDKFSIREKINDVIKEMRQLFEERFQTYRGVITSDDEIKGLALESGQYVINTVKKTIVYNHAGNLMETISGLLPNFNNRVGPIMPMKGDYDTTQIVDGESTLDSTLNMIKKQLEKSATIPSILSQSDLNTDPPDAANGAMFIVQDKVTFLDWNGSGEYICLDIGSIILYKDGWHYFPSAGSSLNNITLKVGGLLSEIDANAVNGSLVFVDDAAKDSPNETIKGLYDTYGRGTLLIKMNSNTFVNALPEVVNAGSVHVDCDAVKATNLVDCITELSKKIDAKANSVGRLFITDDKPKAPSVAYTPNDYGIVTRDIKHGYIYNGLDYTELNDIQAGTEMMLSDTHEWVITREPLRFIGVVHNEDELSDVVWKGPMSCVMMLANTQNYKFGNLINREGSVINDPSDFMPCPGNFYNSDSIKMSIRQLDSAMATYLFAEKTFIDYISLDGWTSDLSTCKIGDYFIASNTGKIAPTSAVLPNKLVTKGNIVIFNGTDWGVLNHMLTTDFIKIDDMSLTDYIRQSEQMNITEICGFVDLTNDSAVENVKNCNVGQVYKVCITDPKYPDFARGDYITKDLVKVRSSDLSKIPCTFDQSCLSLEDYLTRRKPIVLPGETIINIQDKYPGVVSAYSNMKISCKWDENGLLDSVMVEDNIVKQNLFLKYC